MAHTRYRTRAIALKKENKGEADQLLTVFTEDFGKIQVLGRAIRKITSKLRSGIDLFYYTEIEFIQGKNYKTLTDAVLIDKFAIIPRAAEIIDTLVGHAHKDARLWQLLQLQRSDLYKNNRGLTYTSFAWEFFDVLGYKPELYNCAHCHNKLLPGRLFFAPRAGGVVCQRCFANLEKEPTDCSITSRDIKILRFLLSHSTNQILCLKIEPTDMQNLEKITENYFNFLREAINPQKDI